MALNSKLPWNVKAGLVAAFTALAPTAPAQIALHNSIENQTARSSVRAALERPDYTLKYGDFRLLARPMLGFDYNDNIDLRETGELADFILRPTLQLTALHPLTQNNLLFIDLGIGYDYYLDHNDYSGFRLNTGSQISYDIFLQDVRINLHDRVSYLTDASRQPSLANSGPYKLLENTVGVGASWDLNKLSLGAGYDHQNSQSLEEEFTAQNRASELFYLRVAKRFHPQLTAGAEGGVSLTRYDEQILNDNTGYSAGVYADWRPGTVISIIPRVGYSLYTFDNTSAFLNTPDNNAWYFDITLRHGISKSISYSVSFGHEILLGIQTDLIEQWYFRPALEWSILRNLVLTPSLEYEHGTQGWAFQNASFEENFDYYSFGISASTPILKRLTGSLSYRLTYRDSNLPGRSYTQNLVGIMLTYTL